MKQFPFYLGCKTAARLAAYRKRAAGSTQGSKDWRTHRYGPLFQKESGFTYQDGKLFADRVEDVADYVADASDLIRLDYTAWYTDSFESGTLKGGVCKMRCPRGVFYIPVTSHSHWDGVTLYMKDRELVAKGAHADAHTEAKREAARSADHYAEKEAEACREADAKFQAEQQISDNKEAICENLKTMAEITAAMAAAPDGLLRDIASEKKDGLERENAKLQARIEALNENFWKAVE